MLVQVAHAIAAFSQSIVLSGQLLYSTIILHQCYVSCVQSTLMVRVWKVTNWTEVHDRMKEGERIYSDKFPIANVTGTWQVYYSIIL